MFYLLLLFVSVCYGYYHQCFLRLKVLNPRIDELHVETGEDDGSESSLGRIAIRAMSVDAAKEEEVPEYRKRLEKEKQVGSFLYAHILF